MTESKKEILAHLKEGHNFDLMTEEDGSLKNAWILGRVLAHPKIEELTDPVVLVEISRSGRRIQILLGGSTPVIDWGSGTKYHLE